MENTAPSLDLPHLSATQVRYVVLVPAVVIAVMAVLSWTQVLTSSPDVSRSVVELVDGLPSWSVTVLEVVTEGGLVVLAAGLLIAVWRARGGGSVALARVVAVTGGTVLAYVASEGLKSVEAQERPCRALADIPAIVHCPGAGDWSLPSNHAAIAAALATALALASPRWRWHGFGLAVTVAASRVALGVHYPHDVLTGLLLGSGVVVATAIVLERPARSVLELAWRHRAVRWLLPMPTAADPWE